MAAGEDRAPAGEAPWRLALLSVGALGVSCVMTQLALMRELLAAFSGNEMMLGVTLGLWLLLMGVGTWLGRGCEKLRHPYIALAFVQILVALVPLVQVFLLRGLRDVVFLRGAAVGLSGTVAATFVLLLPYCLVAGFGLTLACAILAPTEGPAAIGRVYIADSVGSVLGGFLFTLVLVRFLDHIGILIFPALVNLLAASALGWRCLSVGRGLLTAPLGRQMTPPGAGGTPRPTTAVRLMAAMRGGKPSGVSLVALALGAGLIGAALLMNLDALSTAWQYPRQRVVARANSPYGRLIVTESAGQFDFIENGVPITSTRDDQRVEETVHYAMVQRPQARNVLLISGGISGTAREILKYPVSRVDYVELDPQILEVGRKYLPENLAGRRIRIINSDARLFIKRISANYDVIIIDLPPPSTAQLNRFYTVEFLAQAKRALAGDGVLGFSLGQYENYVSPELARVLASARRSVGHCFRNVLVLPGGRVFFLASDGPLSADIAARLEARRVVTKLVNRHYLDAMLTPDRMADVADACDQPARLNRDFSPVLYYYHLRHWMSQFGTGFGLAPVALLLLLGWYVMRLRGAAVVLFASGFAASALEVVLLLAFQVLCGSVYHQLGLMVTLFMAGLALGAWLVNRPHAVTGTSESASPGSGARRADFDQATGRGNGDATDLGVCARPPSAAAHHRKPLALSAFAISGYALLLPQLLPLLDRLGGTTASRFAVKLIIGLLTLALALLVGMQFPLANRLEFGGGGVNAARLYAADFIGACLGALLASALLIPLIGVAGVGLVTAVLNGVGGAFAWRVCPSRNPP